MNVDDVFRADHIRICHSKSDTRPGLRSHSHRENEILYILSGEVECSIEEVKFPVMPGSLVLIPPDIFHGWKSLSPRLFHRVSTHFMQEYLDKTEQSLLLEMFNTGPHFFPNTSSRNINFFVQALLECKDMKQPLQGITLKSRLVSLLSELTVLCSSHTVKPEPADKRILEVLKFLQQHLREELFLEDVADRFNISKNYLNILFRQVTGTTVNHYIRIKRLGLARQEILKGLSAEEAAYDSGFNDYSNFYRAYKAYYGCMPSAMWKRRQGITVRAP